LPRIKFLDFQVPAGANVFGVGFPAAGKKPIAPAGASFLDKLGNTSDMTENMQHAPKRGDREFHELDPQAANNLLTHFSCYCALSKGHERHYTIVVDFNKGVMARNTLFCTSGSSIRNPAIR
jgi:hypothetical protein